MDDERAEGERAAFDQLLDMILSNTLWDAALVSVLTALRCDLDEWQRGTNAFSSWTWVAWRIEHVLGRLRQRLAPLTHTEPHEQLSGLPGAHDYLSWVNRSLQEAGMRIETAQRLAQDGGARDEVANALGCSVYFTAASTTLLATYDKFLPPRNVEAIGPLN